MNFDEEWDPKEKLAADIAAAELVIQYNAVHNAPHAALAKAWLAQLELLAATLRAGPDAAAGAEADRCGRARASIRVGARPRIALKLRVRHALDKHAL